MKIPDTPNLFYKETEPIRKALLDIHVIRGVGIDVDEKDITIPVIRIFVLKDDFSLTDALRIKATVGAFKYEIIEFEVKKRPWEILSPKSNWATNKPYQYLK